MTLPFLLDLPGSMEWAFIIITIVVFALAMAGVGYLIYRIVRKAVRDEHRNLSRK